MRKTALFVFVILAGLAATGVSLATRAVDATAPLRIGIFADLHANDTDSPGEKKVMTNYAERLTAFVETMNAWPADLVIDLGDLVNGRFVVGADLGAAERIPGILAAAEAVYARFAGPRYYVLGNHDVYDLSKDEFLVGTAAEWTYGSFDAGAYHLVILDAQFKKNDEPMAKMGWVVQGKIPQAELDWLRTDLAATTKPTLVFVHQQLNVAFDLLSGGPEISNAADVRAVLKESGKVVAVLQGHDHEAALALVDGIRYLTFEALVEEEGRPLSWARITLDPVARTVTVDGEGDQADWTFAY